MKITAFGEVLWDDFPSGKILGGAPLNVLVRLSGLGADCSIISRCGRDADGDELLRQVRAKGVAADLIQRDAEQATSLVKVSLNESGSASYEIVYPCAWDKIEADPAALARAAESDVFLYGSLAVRDTVSRRALEALLAQAKFKIFDVNLRKPHYQIEYVIELMKKADLVKLNDSELYELAAACGSPYHSLEQNIRYLCEYTDTESACITLGEHGAVYYRDGNFYYHGGFHVTVADTVGSGDSFLAGFIYQLLNRADPAPTLHFACAVGALVAAKHGATPELAMAEILDFMEPKHP